MHLVVRLLRPRPRRPALSRRSAVNHVFDLSASRPRPSPEDRELQSRSHLRRVRPRGFCNCRERLWGCPELVAEIWGNQKGMRTAPQYKGSRRSDLGVLFLSCQEGARRKYVDVSRVGAGTMSIRSSRPFLIMTIRAMRVKGEPAVMQSFMESDLGCGGLLLLTLPVWLHPERGG